MSLFFYLFAQVSNLTALGAWYDEYRPNETEAIPLIPLWLENLFPTELQEQFEKELWRITKEYLALLPSIRVERYEYIPPEPEHFELQGYKKSFCWRDDTFYDRIVNFDFEKNFERIADETPREQERS